MKHILMNIILPCAAALTLISCIDDYESNTASEKDTYIHLNVSTAALQSRASDESAANPNAESDIKSVRVWAFNSDLTGEGVLPVSYKEETNLSKNSSYTLSMKIPRNSGGTELKNLDLFILANGESGSNLYGDGFSPKEVTRKDLQEAKLSDKFVIGTDGKPTDASVPTTGLPISRYVTGIDVDSYKTETESATSPALNIPIQRAVSKIHFFFARKDVSYASQAEVTKIELDGGKLSTGSYVFPDGADYANLSTEGLKASGSVDYLSGKTVLDGVSGTDIKAVTDPKEYIRGENEDANEYLSRLATAGITSQDLAYYNETDKPISGTIYYKVYSTGEERSKDFEIPADATSRNHEVLVYGYFNAEGHLELNYAILDWDKTANTNVETKDLSYLNVYPTLVFMRNVNTNTEVNFSASNTCTVSIEKVYYYDKDNEEQTIAEDSKQYPTVTITDGDKQGKVSISSPLPNENVANNLTVKYIKFKVKLNGTNKEQEVLVKQYPLEYAQNIEGEYSTRSSDNWVSKTKEYTKNSGIKYSDNGFTAKIYKNGQINIYKGKDKYEYDSWNYGHLTNRYMYVMQITSTNGNYTIAHPNLNSDGSSDDNVVSPAFMIASQLGAVSSSGFNATTAITHCQTYREVDTDGNEYDKWRLPTEAEVKIIIEYQGKTNSPIANVLTGQYYRTLNKKTADTGYTDRSTYVRCVRDLTPDEVTKLENRKQ